MPGNRTALFLYGTLKRGKSNHSRIGRQQFVCEARTAPGFALYDAGGYPALVRAPGNGGSVLGEVWLVDDACLQELDHFEGVHEGLYRREPIRLAAPHGGISVDAYIYGRDIGTLPRLGDAW